MIETALLAMLKNCDTPTVCNAIEVAQGQRGFAGYTKKTMLCSSPDEPAIVGFARTAKIAGREPPSDDVETIRAVRLDYFRSMAAGPRPAIAVVEDLDYPDCIAAWWGEVHTAVHKGLGLNGALTNGAMRDLGDMEPGFPVVAGSVGPSHGYCHVESIGGTVEICGLVVDEGDLVHADRHGAVVIPADIVGVLGTAIERLRETEHIILDAARRPGFDLEMLESVWARFEDART